MHTSHVAFTVFTFICTTDITHANQWTTELATVQLVLDFLGMCW